MRRASPSVMARSGSKVARARRPPIIGMVPIGLARISPSPRKHSAMATTHTSARSTRPASWSRHRALPSARSLAWYSASSRSSQSARNSAHASGDLAADGVLLLERLVARVVGIAGGEVGAVGRLDHAVDEQPADEQRLRRALLGEVLGGHDPLGGQEAPLGGAEEEVVHVRVGAEVLAVAARVGPVHVHEGGVHRQGGHGHQLLAVVERRRHHPHAVVVTQDVGPEPDPGGQERHPPRGRLEPEEEHALVVGLVLDGPRLAGGPEVRLERDRVERHEGVDEALHLARPHRGARRRGRPSSPR